MSLYEVLVIKTTSTRTTANLTFGQNDSTCCDASGRSNVLLKHRCREQGHGSDFMHCVKRMGSLGLLVWKELRYEVLHRDHRLFLVDYSGTP